MIILTYNTSIQDGWQLSLAISPRSVEFAQHLICYDSLHRSSDYLADVHGAIVGDKIANLEMYDKKYNF